MFALNGQGLEFCMRMLITCIGVVGGGGGGGWHVIFHDVALEIFLFCWEGGQNVLLLFVMNLASTLLPQA